LKTKLGTVTSLRTLRFNLKELAKSNHLPEYNISLENDVIVVSRKEPPKERKDILPKHITKKEIEKEARRGETYDQVRDRLSGKSKIDGLRKAVRGSG